MTVSHGQAVWCMDYDKARSQWQCLRSESLSHVVARAPTVRILVSSQLTMVDGGRHGYLVARGELLVSGDVITIIGGEGDEMQNVG